MLGMTAPMNGLIDPAYLKSRSALIKPERSMGRAAHGTPPGVSVALGADATLEAEGTSHISIVDAGGNAVAMTTTIESAFGARIMVRGFLLNNELTDFSWIENGGEPGNPAAANAVAGGKRPRSAMAPTFVFTPVLTTASAAPPVTATPSAAATLPATAIPSTIPALRAISASPVVTASALRSTERLEFVLGSPGGPPIINYVAKALVGLIDWKLPLADTFALPHYGSRNRTTEIEKGTRIEALALSLKALGHEISIGDFTSGYTGIAVTPGGLTGAVDPRREGTARGE